MYWPRYNPFLLFQNHNVLISKQYIIIKFLTNKLNVFGSPILKRIQIIDYVLAYITMDIDGSASAKEFVGIYFMITVYFLFLMEILYLLTLKRNETCEANIRCVFSSQNFEFKTGADYCIYWVVDFYFVLRIRLYRF